MQLQKCVKYRSDPSTLTALPSSLRMTSWSDLVKYSLYPFDSLRSLRVIAVGRVFFRMDVVERSLFV